MSEPRLDTITQGGYRQVGAGSDPRALPVGLPSYPRFNHQRVRHTVIAGLAVVLFGLFLYGSAVISKVNVVKLVTDAPKIGTWVRLMFPPYDTGFRKPPIPQELNAYLFNAAQTVAMATVGVVAAAVLAVIPAVFASRVLTPSPWVFYPTRWFLNALRAIDSFVFALFFVAAVGLGPFAGVLGIAVHTWGTLAKVFAETIDNAQLSPMYALEAAGVGRTKALLHALLPDVMPMLISVTLFWWEFTVRASIALGIVGAGGIGQDVKNAIDLLNFPHLGALIVIIILMVTVIDEISTRLQRLLR
jgi:phosphonate transport system permease protein